MNDEHLDHKCEYCKKKLRIFKVYLDWTNRTLHKSCYKKIEEQLIFETDTNYKEMTKH